jgi:RNA polymerase sigma factor (sigma-70 family)
MVYRVCWRILRQEQDTEDAFQATFLILAQKLRRVRQHASLASWLHGIGHRVALKARAQAAARRRHELKALTEKLPPDEVTWRELRTVLDAELEQLPEKWRLPLVLCYLEGRTQDEAATQLGWSNRTLRRRLEEARAALGRRLTRRGVVWSAALSAVLLSDCVASAALAPGLVSSTVEVAACIAAGQAVTTAAISANVAALTEGVMKAMFMTKIKIITAVLLAVCVFGMGVGASGLVCRTQAAEKAIPQPVAGLPPTTAAAQGGQKGKDELQELYTKQIRKYVTVHVAKREIENALKRLREATKNDKETEFEALVEIEQVVKEMKEKAKKAPQKEQKQGAATKPEVFFFEWQGVKKLKMPPFKWRGGDARILDRRGQW